MEVEYFPTAQLMHCVANAIPEAVENVPALQFKQVKFVTARNAVE
jgi:hypothetical protein